MRDQRPPRRPCKRCGQLTRSRSGRCTPCSRKGGGCHCRADGQEQRIAVYARRAAARLPLFSPPVPQTPEGKS